MSALEFAPVVSVNDACVGCGGCVGACPTGAFDGAPLPDAVLADGFDKTRLEAGTLVLACARGPSVLGATAVPCLGRVTVELLCEAMRRGARRIALVASRCEECNLAAAAAPLAAAVELAQAIGVAAFGSGFALGRGLDVLGPASVTLELGDVQNAPRTPLAGTMDRRGFLRALGRGGLPAVAALSSPDAPSGAAPRPSRRARLLEVLASLGVDRAPIALPEGAPFGVVQVGPGCFGCNVCGQVCPTGALRPCVEGATFTLLADDRRCVACGACRDACLDRAIRIEPLRELPPAGLRAAARRSGRPCVRCGRFAPAGALCRFCSPAEGGRLRGAARSASPC